VTGQTAAGRRVRLTVLSQGRCRKTYSPVEPPRGRSLGAPDRSRSPCKMANLQLSLVSPETHNRRKWGVEGSATIIRNIAMRHRSGPLGARRCRRTEALNAARGPWARAKISTGKEFCLLVQSTCKEKPSRGDWTPLEPFIAGVRGWEAGLGRLMGDGKLDKCRSCVRSEEVE